MPRTKLSEPRIQAQIDQKWESLSQKISNQVIQDHLDIPDFATNPEHRKEYDEGLYIEGRKYFNNTNALPNALKPGRRAYKTTYLRIWRAGRTPQKKERDKKHDKTLPSQNLEYLRVLKKMNKNPHNQELVTRRDELRRQLGVGISRCAPKKARNGSLNGTGMRETQDSQTGSLTQPATTTTTYEGVENTPEEGFSGGISSSYTRPAGSLRPLAMKPSNMIPSLGALDSPTHDSPSKGGIYQSAATLNDGLESTTGPYFAENYTYPDYTWLGYSSNSNSTTPQMLTSHYGPDFGEWAPSSTPQTYNFGQLNFDASFPVQQPLENWNESDYAGIGEENSWDIPDEYGEINVQPDMVPRF